MQPRPLHPCSHLAEDNKAPENCLCVISLNSHFLKINHNNEGQNQNDLSGFIGHTHGPGME